MIREMVSSDAEAVLEICKLDLLTRNTTFETIVPNWTNWDSKHLKHTRFAFTKEGKIVAWAARSAVSTRKVYPCVIELSIYVATSTHGHGFVAHLQYCTESQSSKYETISYRIKKLGGALKKEKT